MIPNLDRCSDYRETARAEALALSRRAQTETFGDA